MDWEAAGRSETAALLSNVASFWAAYKAHPEAYDEMCDRHGCPRAGHSHMLAEFLATHAQKFDEIRARADRMFLNEGVTFNVYGDSAGAERIFPFDPIPRVIDADTWATLEAGLIQRVKALNAFVGDVYGEGAILKDGVVPTDLIKTSSQFRRAAFGINPPNGVHITVAGIDLVRAADAQFRVLEDNVRTPSGVSYVIKNRLVMTRLVPELIRSIGVRSVEHYPADLLASLCEIAPSGASRPTVALLTPGAYNSAFFEHVFLSQQMGIELVEGCDLVCADHKLYMKTVGGLRQVDVLYRRIDDDFLDPVVFRPDSMLGVPGLTAVLKAGGAALANGIGTGVADDKAVYAYTPAMIRYYLAEEPILPIVDTYLLRDPEMRKMVLRDIDQYVVKPTGASGGYGVVIGPRASDRELAETREHIENYPDNFIAQPVVQISVHPTIVGHRADGCAEVAPRHIDFRPFVLLGERPRVLPGGLTRVALREGSLIVNSSQGGGSKDTWVMAS
ncbi:MAG TPA: circularly permuted type 2 ATP-grasp protein [Candidatus Binataceae bacterium]|nr:circularly permuted type 2 ATP-grasp protein [Candidatus Binataceae bacterium]